MVTYLYSLFIHMLQVGYQAGIAVLLVCAARLVLNRLRVPKKYLCFLWFIPFVRLVLPFQLQSIFSLFRLFPNQSESAVLSGVSFYRPMFPNLSDEAAPPAAQTLPQSLVSAPGQAAGGMSQLFWLVLSVIWLTGIAFFILYAVFSVLLLKKRLRTAVCESDNIYLADNIQTAFVLGLCHTRIYLPSHISPELKGYVICHEKQHIRRKDHIVKIILFLLTAFYWCHPLIWAAWLLANREIEFACDEAVIASQSLSYRQRYASALLSLSGSGRGLLKIPMAFSEKSPKKRIQHIMAYKKPLLVTAVAGAAVIALLAFGLLTNPPSETDTPGTPDMPDTLNVQVWETSYIPEDNDPYAIIHQTISPTAYQYADYFKPEDIHDLVKIEIFMDGAQSATEYDEVLKWVETRFSQAVPVEGNPGCPFPSVAMYLTRADGKIGMVYPASDGCTIFRTKDGFYAYEAESSEFWGLLSDWSRYYRYYWPTMTLFDVPAEVLAQAESYAAERIQRSPSEYSDSRIEYIAHAYTYPDFEGRTLEIYQFNFELKSVSPENLSLAGGAYLTEDGWYMPDYPNAYYLVFERDAKGLHYLTWMFENDTWPGEESFTNDMTLDLEQSSGL